MSDTFRRAPRLLTENEKIYVHNIKVGAEFLEADLAKVADPRCRALALTKLEEAVMWAVKGVTG